MQDMQSMQSRTIAEYLDELLGVGGIPDYSNALNGLQLENTTQIRKIAAAVDISTSTIGKTIEADANLLIVHHGMFWGGLQPIRGSYYTRLKTLIDNDVAVYASHLPLDCHPVLGNNVLLAEALGLTPTGQFAQYKSIMIGVRGESDIATSDLANTLRAFAQSHGGDVRTTPITPSQRTSRWAICTGGGANSDTLREAHMLGVDTLIVGEGPHHTAVDAQEIGLTILYAGHYATETLGVQALAQHLSDRLGIPWTFIPAPTGL